MSPVEEQVAGLLEVVQGVGVQVVVQVAALELMAVSYCPTKNTTMPTDFILKSVMSILIVLIFNRNEKTIITGNHVLYKLEN